jgi:oxalate decarboxylase
MQSYRYRLERQKPKKGQGGITRGASVKEFPVSTGIAGVSMRLEPGGIRELHWHANAAEWGYVVTGSCRTTLIEPDGSSYIDTFYPGDVWYFPRGYGHSIQGLGPGECHFILIFDNGNFSEDHTFSITDFLAQTPNAVVAQNLGLAERELKQLPKKEAYFVQGTAPNEASKDAERRTQSELTSKHRYPLGAKQPRRAPGGGTQRTVTVDDFPVAKTIAGSIIELQPGAIRELHWHPNADEWQYYLEGDAEMMVFLAEGHAVVEQLEAGDVGYVPMGAGHYIRNTGAGICRVLIGFNNGIYEAIDMSEWLANNPVDVLSSNLNLPREEASKLPHETLFIIPDIANASDDRP